MAVNFHISKDGNLITIRHIKDSFDLAGAQADAFVTIPRYQEDFNTTTYPLTASNPTGNNIKIVGADGRIIISSIDFASLKTGSSNANVGASAAATVSTLNGTSFFGASSVDFEVGSNTASHTANSSSIASNLTKITALENTVKSLSGDRGIYITDNKDENSSKVKLTATLARLQAGSKTSIEIEESSPGTLTFEVAAGPSGSEVATTVLEMEGNAQGKTQAEFTTSLFSIKSNSTTGAGSLSLLEASVNGTNRLSFKAPAALTADTILVFPDGAGSNGQVLSTNGTGTLSWVDNTGLSAIHAQASDILKLQSNQLGVSNNLSTTIAEDRLVFYDHSDGKLTALELGTNLSITGTTLNAAGGGGGGDGKHYLGAFGGLFTWNSNDDGERLGLNATYGAYFYSHSTEPDQAALKTYDASQEVDSATSTMDNYKLIQMAFPVQTTNKKIKCIYSFRITSAPSGSTWGISLWGGSFDTSGATNTERTVTLRGKSSDITVDTNTLKVYHGEFTTASTINGGRIIPLLENRTGSLTTTTRIYGSFKLYLVD